MHDSDSGGSDDEERDGRSVTQYERPEKLVTVTTISAIDYPAHARAKGQ